jgi:hypothetical protein
MPLLNYYLSQSPCDPWPEDGKVFFHEAASPSAAVSDLIRQGRMPPNWKLLWIHFLVWTDPQHGFRGFESLPLSRYADSQPPPDVPMQSLNGTCERESSVRR